LVRKWKKWQNPDNDKEKRLKAIINSVKAYIVRLNFRRDYNMIKMEEYIKLSGDLIERNITFFKKMAKFNEMIISPPDVKVGQTPAEIVYRKHKVKLLRYIPQKETLYKTPILIVYALINRPYIVDLLPGRSIVEVLVKNGYDVYLVDWGEPTESDSKHGLHKYINFYLDKMVDKTLEIREAEKLTVLGYCMGGTMSLIYTALYREKVKNLITMATPFDCSSNEGLLFQWSKDFPAAEIEQIYGNCPGWLMASSFLLINPMKQIDKGFDFHNGILNPSFVELFLAMEKWLRDIIDLPGRLYTEIIEDWFQKNLLMENKFVLGNKKVDFKKITCPYLNLVADEDTSIPPSSSIVIGDKIGSRDKTLMTSPVGHIGLSVSGKALKKLWPEVVDWLRERS